MSEVGRPCFVAQAVGIRAAPSLLMFVPMGKRLLSAINSRSRCRLAFAAALIDHCISYPSVSIVIAAREGALSTAGIRPISRGLRGAAPERGEEVVDRMQKLSPTAGQIRHLAIVIVVFSITGMLAVAFSQLMLNQVLSMDGSLWSGPWSYRVAYVLLVPPFYSITLVGVGTLFGKHAFFKHRVLRMWRRVLPLGS